MGGKFGVYSSEYQVLHIMTVGHPAPQEGGNGLEKHSLPWSAPGASQISENLLWRASLFS